MDNEKKLKKVLSRLVDEIGKLLGEEEIETDEIRRKMNLYDELGSIAEETNKALKKVILVDPEEETVEELEMLVEAHKGVLKTCESILENRKSH